MAIVRAQAVARSLGGRSSREARRSGGRFEEREGVILWPSGVGGGSNEGDAEHFSDEPTGVEGGKSGAWQGAEFRQGLSDKADRERSFAGVFLEVSVFFVEPQQQEAPRHLGPQLQSRACDAASNESTLDAPAWPTSAQASTSTAAGQGRWKVLREGWVIGTRTEDVAAWVSGRVEALMIEAD